MLLGGNRIIIHACHACPAAPALVQIFCRVARNSSPAPKFAGRFPVSSSMKTVCIQPWIFLPFEAMLLEFLSHRFLWAAVPHAQGFQGLPLMWLQVNVQAVRHQSGRQHALLAIRSVSAIPFKLPEYTNFPSSAIPRFHLLGLLLCWLSSMCNSSKEKPLPSVSLYSHRLSNMLADTV